MQDNDRINIYLFYDLLFYNLNDITKDKYHK